jgi:riboflavin kinase/FMN adenylyltransferase
MIKSVDELYDCRYPVVTMGTFDGVHLGHQELLKKVKERAILNNGEAVAITYYHHPKEILSNIATPYLLTERERKTSLLKEMGIDKVIYLNFDENMSKQSADFFLNEILIKRVKAREIVFGYDCHFGNNREGNCSFLKTNEEKYDYKTYIVEPVYVDGKIVSSSIIRELITKGDVKQASSFLGRNYNLQGEVVHGLGIGRELGFPTINIKPLDENKLLPANGVYLCRTIIDGNQYYCLTNIGYAPTVKQDGQRTVESFLLNFEGELYHKHVMIEFIERLRDEEKFPNRDTLISAIKLDVKTALKLVGE